MDTPHPVEPTAPHRHTKKYAYTAIVERIGALIRSGELGPGDRLPPERKLAEELGVSRTSVRQAFQALAERKIIESRQGDGTYVAAALEAPFPGDAILDAISRQSGVLEDVLEFRRLMEPQIAALAAERINPAGLDRLKVLVCDQQRALLAGREDAGLDAEFHRLLAECSGNRVIGRVMAAVQTVIDESRAAWLRGSDRQNTSLEGHLRLLDALESRDAGAASLAMEQHISEIGNHILGPSEPE